MPNTLYLSYIANATTTIGGQGEPHAEALALYDLLCDDPLQQRPVCIWDDRLAACAQEHATDMATRGYFSHTTPEGINANKRARLAGYVLPIDWPDNDNYIESIAINYQTPAEVWQGWLHSEVHRTHVLGLTKFFAEQTSVGVGYWVGNTPYPKYWCVVSAPPQVGKL